MEAAARKKRAELTNFIFIWVWGLSWNINCLDCEVGWRRGGAIGSAPVCSSRASASAKLRHAKKKLKQKAAEAAGESVFMDYEKKKEVGEKAGKGE